MTADALTFESLNNFRDAGGVATADGRFVRSGRLFRSDSLAGVSPRDAVRLRDLGIRLIIDLRRPDELQQFGRIADTDWWRYQNVPPTHPLWDDSSYDPDAGTARYLADRYAELVEHGARDLVTALRLLADPEGTPAVVHCFAGKDRTGVLIALTLALLSVADEDIAADYALTANWVMSPPPADMPAHWLESPAEAMMIFLAELREQHGSVERFAAAAGLTDPELAALRSALVS